MAFARRLAKPKRICCINCNILLNFTLVTSRRVLDLDSRVVSLISNWISPIIITEADRICGACFNLSIQTVNGQIDESNVPDRCAGPSRKGHKHVCLICGLSLLRRRSHDILKMQAHQEMIKIVENRIEPRQISQSDRVCHACWHSVRREVTRNQRNKAMTDDAVLPVVKREPQDIHEEFVQLPPRQSKSDEPVKVEPVPNEDGADVAVLDLMPTIVKTELDDLNEESDANLLVELPFQPESEQFDRPVSNDGSAHDLDEESNANLLVENVELPCQAESKPFDSPVTHDGRAHDLDEEPEDANLLVVLPSQSESSPKKPVPDTITLPNYRRAPNTASHCVFHGCVNISHLHTFPKFQRSTIFRKYRYYISQFSRVCSEHLLQNKWDTLFDAPNSLNTFTAKQIEHIFSDLIVVRP